MVKKKKTTKKTAKKAAPAQATSLPKVKFETTQGTFEAELYPDVAKSTANFLQLTSSGFYDGLIFHRYVAGFVIQGGDPTGTGTGGSSKNIPLEITSHKHLQGALGMARSAHPDSASSQFYVCLEDTPNLDGSYTVFGRVTSGMEKVLKLRQGDKMTKVSVLANTVS
jgi:peptidyl-prolyl cis-trans isomerase B (cyclophilin B)